MPTFAYQAVGVDGVAVSGSLEAADRFAAAAELQQRGLLPVKVGAAPAPSVWSWRPDLHWQHGVQNDRLVFARTLSFLLTAGVPLDRSLTVSAQLSESAALRQALQEVLRAVKGGKSLSAALERYPKIFPSFYVSLIRAGEASGTLDRVSTQLADYQESVNELRSNLVSAMIYPALLFVVGAASVLFLLEFVVPKFAGVFEQSGAALPLPTQVLLFASGALERTWWLAVIAVPIIFLGVQRYLATERGGQRFDHFILRVPRLGTVIEQIQVSRFARSLGTLLGGGVPMVQSLEIARQVIGNRKLSDAVKHVQQGVKQGEGVVRPLEQTGAFPPLAIHLLGVGEETGRLDAMLLQVASVYERETRTAIKNLVALFEPVMILTMGVVVGTIVVSLLLAIYSINELPM